jgi:hypothetical protein
MKRCRLKRYNFQIKNKMSKEKQTLDKQQNGNDFIADVSNCAFNKVLNEFRQWQREWDLYDKRETLKKPQSSDDFIERLRTKYVIGFKHCC